MSFVCFPAIALEWLDAGVHAHVIDQSRKLRKRFQADVTLIRFLASMRAKMKCQILRTQTRFIARSTHVWSDEHVSSRVCFQIRGTRTRFIARSTHEWSDEHVSSRVQSQSALSIERFITLSAFERFLARMNTLMSFQIARFRKIFIADFTDMSSSSSSSSFFENSVVVVSIWNF